MAKMISCPDTHIADDSRMTVIGHRNPDTDSVSCTAALTYLLSRKGICARRAVSGQVNGETRMVFSRFGLPVPDAVSSVRNEQVILVDHSAYSQAAEGMSEAMALGIVDHHPEGDISAAEGAFRLIRPVGAAATIVTELYEKEGIDIPESLAGALLARILSDTRNLRQNVTKADLAAFSLLKEKSGVRDTDVLYADMVRAAGSYTDLTDEEIYLSDYKEYSAERIRFSIANAMAFGDAEARDLALRLLRVMEKRFPSSDMDVTYAIVTDRSGDETKNAMYMTAFGPGARETLEKAFGIEPSEGLFQFDRISSRKTVIEPALRKVLEER